MDRRTVIFLVSACLAGALAAFFEVRRQDVVCPVVFPKFSQSASVSAPAVPRYGDTESTALPERRPGPEIWPRPAAAEEKVQTVPPPEKAEDERLGPDIIVY